MREFIKKAKQKIGLSKKIQSHNPFRHKELFTQFTVELTNNRKYFLDMTVEDAETHKERFMVMSDMLYVHQWILRHQNEAIAYINLFNMTLEEIKRLDPHDKLYDPEKYAEIMKKLIECCQEAKTQTLNPLGIE